MSELNISFVASGDPDIDTFNRVQSGGTGPIWRLSQEFCKKGHKITIYSSTYQNPEEKIHSGVRIKEMKIPNFNNSVRSIIESSSLAKRYLNVEDLSSSPEKIVERLFVRLLFSAKVAKDIKTSEPDIVYLRDRLSAFMPSKIDLPTVYTVSSPDACDFSNQASMLSEPISYSVFKYKQKVEESVMSSVDRIITMNSQTEDYLYKRGFRGVQTITLSVRKSELCDMSSRVERPIILYVGRLDQNKRASWVIDSFNDVDTDRYEVHIIGDGPRKDHVEQRSKSYEKESEVHFHGQLPRSEVLKWMRQSAVLILPSEFESCSNVILEAMASGCPVIASNTMGPSELIEPGVTGMLFEKYDKRKLVHKLNQILDQPPLRNRISNNAYEYVAENHSTKVIGEKYLSIGSEAMDDRGK